MDKSKLLTVAELRRDYRFSHSGAYRAINAGHIEAVKIGRGTFIIRASVDKYLESLPRLGHQAAA